MGAIKEKFDQVYRDFATDGLSSSGLYDPPKAEVRGIGPMIEAALGNVGIGALLSVTKLTKPLLDADLAHAAGDVALVYADGVDVNNDLYLKSGASGVGGWNNTGILHAIMDGLGRPGIDLARNWASLAAGEPDPDHHPGALSAYQYAQKIAALVDDAVAAGQAVESISPYLTDLTTIADTIDAAENIVLAAPLTTSKAATTTIASNTTLAADPNLTVPFAAYQAKRLRGRIDYSTGATGGFKFRIAGPAGATVQINRRAIAPGAAAYSAVATDVAFHVSDVVVTGAAGSGTVEYDAVIYNGANAGDVQFLWAQNAIDATATSVKAGGEIEAKALIATAPFAFASSAIAKLGDYTGPGASGGHNVISFTQVGVAVSYIEAMITGSSAEAQLFAGSYTITVDGGAPTTVTAPAGWSYVSLFTGLAEVPHRVRIKGNFIDSDIAVRARGKAVAIARPSDIPSYYRVMDATNGYASYIAKDGAPELYTGNYGAGDKRVTTLPSACGFGWRFAATTTSIRAWVYDASNGSSYELLQDGVSIATFNFTGTRPGTFAMITLATGLNGAHEYEIRPITSGRFFYLHAILVDSLSPSAHAAKELDAWYGDSNVEMPIGADARTHAAFLLASPAGRACIRKGLGGQRVSTWGRDNTALVTTGLSQAASRLFNMIGVNDYYYGTPLATLEADYTGQIVNQRAGNATAKIVCIGLHEHYRAPLAGGPYSDTDRRAYNARIQAAVAACRAAGDTNVYYVDPTGWIIGTSPTPDLADGVHLSTAGWIKFRAGLQTALTALGI
ncbi:MAG: GDSL-type esterase/lipase family protein [Candidatus Sphingomonas phytovorans]|nr:GDSL-type esterase/lipase family protein [Sphingomonas sp.]WEK00587.1 MAG: GDSL-type esterase/lipase family protein [Sphingomonas sp.]